VRTPFSLPLSLSCLLCAFSTQAAGEKEGLYESGAVF